VTTGPDAPGSDPADDAGPDATADPTDTTTGGPGGPADGAPSEELRVSDALGGAAGRLVRPLGVALLTAYLFVGFAGAIATTSLFAAVVPRVREFVLANSAAAPADLPPIDPSPLAVGLEPTTAVGLVLVTALLAETVHMVAVRVFVGDARSLPDGALADLRARALVSYVANSLAVVAVFVGLVAFVLPGVFLAAAFYLVRAVVAVEGAGVVPALRRSWRLVAGHRLRVLTVLLFVVLLRQLPTLPGSVVAETPLPDAVGASLGVVLGAVVTTFAIAVAARVYVQLAGIEATAERDAGGADEPAGGEEVADGAEEEPLGALSPEEIDERFGGR
jgi:hypothetical protein